MALPALPGPRGIGRPGAKGTPERFDCPRFLPANRRRSINRTSGKGVIPDRRLTVWKNLPVQDRSLLIPRHTRRAACLSTPAGFGQEHPVRLRLEAASRSTDELVLSSPRFRVFNRAPRSKQHAATRAAPAMRRQTDAARQPGHRRRRRKTEGRQRPGEGHCLTSERGGGR